MGLTVDILGHENEDNGITPLKEPLGPECNCVKTTTNAEHSVLVYHVWGNKNLVIAPNKIKG